MAVETSKVGAGIRGEFPIFEHTTYLNSCSQGALSRRVRAAYEEYLAGWDEHGAEWAHWVERAHDAGALCLADSYQAIGAIDFDARALGVDFATGGTAKYLLGSSGLGFLYVRRELFGELLPTQTGWFADEDIFRMDISDYSPAADARRFDAGTPPVPNIYAGLAGMSLIEEAGAAPIEEHVAA